jgi:hypothetical protein
MVIDKRNIRDFAVSGFRPHGEMELWAEGPVMRVIAQGPFNREAIQALGKAVRDLYVELGPVQRTRCELIEYRRSLLASPDALIELGRLLSLSTNTKQAQLAIALVGGDDVEASSLMLPIVAKIYADHGRPVACFRTVAEALVWLDQRLAGAAP